MKQLKLDTSIRTALAQRILITLRNAAPDSTAQLRGSLAEGREDAYSDIDIFWEIPDELFQTSVFPACGDCLSKLTQPVWNHLFPR